MSSQPADWAPAPVDHPLLAEFDVCWRVFLAYSHEVQVLANTSTVGPDGVAFRRAVHAAFSALCLTLSVCVDIHVITLPARTQKKKPCFYALQSPM